MFILNDKPVEYDFGGSRTRLLASGAQTGDAFCMLEIFSPGNRATPMHRHEHEDETLLLLEGELEVMVDGVPHHVLPGHTLVFPRGTEHQITNRIEQTARYLVICTPAGFDRFVDACADAQPGPVDAGLPTDADKARMHAAAAQFGITLIPPPPFGSSTISSR
ncbi:cupin [Burkholderia plantarii]|uniref:Cupin type-2 domain-containing protein n=1 Tax=Burkholderia plantarii TaxID=41899 RepID=A0A0B6RMY3_BURPL|nr:cupin domain-containing protein [Burkholderia plantarii]AJK46697.1 hypothetical protein BGL_1c21930 [Burkholderia plantarii]ALK30882.1 cupin 2 conserved barrel domain-containing protein [Burkholderia plantarii]WLE59538.1 cupin domain-containing protein [Burkholderia plantarii]GLZ23267.1 cupin [Burkholderia plantarii]